MAKAKKKKIGGAEKHEKKGDEYLAKKKPAKAIAEYQKALEKDSSRKGIYAKLAKAKDAVPGEWEMKDFIESIDWTMKKQEEDNPGIKQVHAKLSPEWAVASKLAVEIFTAKDAAREARLIEELVGMGDIAARALIGMLIELKNVKDGSSRL